MAKSGGSTLGTILKWALILAVVYVIYRWWVGFSTASGTTAISSTTPVAVAPPSSGYANPGGFLSIPGVGNVFNSVQPQPVPILGPFQFNPPSGPVLSPAGGTTPVGPGGGYLPLPIFSSKYGQAL